MSTIQFEGAEARVIDADMKVNHFDESGRFTHQTTDGLLLEVPGVEAACLAKPDGSGGYVATIPDWRARA